MKKTGETVLVGKNRQRALWALIMISLAIPASGWFVYVGLRRGGSGAGWVMVLFGTMGLVAFATYGVMLIRTMASPWHLEVSRSHLGLYTPSYDLSAPWERVVGIAVDEVDRRLGCVLVFDDVPAVVETVTFRSSLSQSDRVMNARSMQTRMERNFRQRGYHLGIPGRILELGPEALAELLTNARTGALWHEQ